MKIFARTVICLAFVFLFVSFAQAQKTKTIKGYFCGGEPEGNAFASSRIRVGNRVFEFTESLKYVKYVGMKKKNATKVGAEYIVKYETDGEGINWTKSLTFTGRRKEIEPCN